MTLWSRTRTSWSFTVGELIRFECPGCGRSLEEVRGPLMSDMGWERAERRERRRLFMRGLRDRMRGVERGEPIGREDEEYPFYELTCRRCGLEMKPTMFAMLD